VSDGDVWIFDRESRTLISGDLVTLPLPLFDTACPEGWQQALSRVADVDFETLAPGHGEPMSRETFSSISSGIRRASRLRRELLGERCLHRRLVP
jgi:glyoxylase-like metal-dependent hydrolase (beta-lactamase superfamily II)